MKKIIEERKSRSIRENAMREMRKTRAKLEKEHPEMLAGIRRLLALSQKKTKAGDVLPKQNEKLQPNPQPESDPKHEPRGQESIKIDRNKNLEAVLKYAAKNPGSQALKDSLKEFLN